MAGFQKFLKMKITRKPKVLDLFAGCGGLSIGLQKAGFNISWANELDEDAAQTFGSIHTKTRLYNICCKELLGRLVKNETDDLKRGAVDLLSGGPPCQGFSGYNRFRGLDDPRNSMVDVFLNFAEVLSPKYILMENVPGLLAMDEGKVVRGLLVAFNTLGYSVDIFVLQAGYYGLPQNRWRVFLIGTKKGIEAPTFPVPRYKFPRTTLFGAKEFRNCVIKPSSEEGDLFNPPLKPTITVADAISDLPKLKNGDKNDAVSYITPAQSKFQKELRSHSNLVYDHISSNLGEIMMERISAVPRKPKAGWLDLPQHLKPKNLLRHGDNRYPNRFGRLWWEGIFNTIVTKAEPYWGRVIHPIENRVISVRESARAQGLPDNIKFHGNLSSKYRQVGNAVPPPLSKALGLQIIKALNNG